MCLLRYTVRAGSQTINIELAVAISSGMFWDDVPVLIFCAETWTASQSGTGIVVRSFALGILITSTTRICTIMRRCHGLSLLFPMVDVLSLGPV